MLDKFENPGAVEINRFIAGMKTTIDKEVREIGKGLRKVVKEATPVKTGQLKKSFTPLIKIKKWDYAIQNTQDYADLILRRGRIGPGRGSLKLPKGLMPVIVQYFESKLN